MTMTRSTEKNSLMTETNPRFRFCFSLVCRKKIEKIGLKIQENLKLCQKLQKFVIEEIWKIEFIKPWKTKILSCGWSKILIISANGTQKGNWYYFDFFQKSNFSLSRESLRKVEIEILHIKITKYKNLIF